jgi:hypothetical protein
VLPWRDVVVGLRRSAAFPHARHGGTGRSGRGARRRLARRLRPSPATCCRSDDD